jgi:hypothetical protein
MILKKEIVRSQDKFYVVVRKIKDDQPINVDWIQYLTKAEFVFRASEYIWFVNEIKDIEPIEEPTAGLETPQ